MYDTTMRSGRASRCPSLAVAAMLLMTAGPRAVAQDGAAWFGFGIECSYCRSEARGGATRWYFTSPPVLVSVAAESPAARAGLEAGDVLTHINSISLVSDAGSATLASVHPGDSVALTYRRGSRVSTATVRTAHMPLAVLSRDSQPVGDASAALPQRFSGTFAGADIVARGEATILIAERECWMEIRTATSVVRLTQRDGCRTAGRGR